MRRDVPVGIDDFGKLTDKENQYYFIDKSLFIKEILDDGSSVVLIIRPRRWGKTLNMSMLQYFFAAKVLDRDTKGMFDNLSIGKVDDGACLAHQGQYPVIFITFKSIQHKKFSDATDALRLLIKLLYEQYNYLLLSEKLSANGKKDFQQYLDGEINKAQIEIALLFLSECLYKHHKTSVYILIDEYDTPLNYAYEYDYVDDMTNLIKNLFSAALKGNPYLKKGIMTGILRISKDSMLSGLNNLNLFSVLDDRYSAYFGFSDQEVEELFVKCGIACKLEAVRHYYNGYRIGDLSLYNPWSVIKCLDKDGNLQPYWVNTSSDRILKKLILASSGAAKEHLYRLINDKDYFVETLAIDTIRFDDLDLISNNALWNLLLATGYLTPFSKKWQNLNCICKLGIPNEEIRYLYISIFQNWLLERIDYGDYRLFLEDLLQGRIESFTKKLSGYLLSYGSYYDFPRESNYHTFMLGLLCSLTSDYWLFSNTEMGTGRADMVLISRDTQYHNAVILEFKHHKDQPSGELALAALEQIDVKAYAAFINRYQHIEKVLKIALVFSGKQAVSAYRWDNADGVALEDAIVVD